MDAVPLSRLLCRSIVGFSIMLTQNQIALHRCKYTTKFTAKGGDYMSEVRDIMLETMKGVRDGSCPIATAEQIHLAGHRAVMDVYSECRQEELGLRKESLAKSLEAMRGV